MKLTVLSDYGSKEKIVSEQATSNQIIQTITGIDWHAFHQVILHKDNGDWMEVSGSLGDDGLSSMYEEDGVQYVINRPPSSIKHMTTILMSYLSGDQKYKINNTYV